LKFAIVVALLTRSAWAQAGLDVPLVGRMIDASGALRDVTGIAGAFTLGEAKVPQVLSIACGVEMCLAKTDSQVISDASAVDAPPGSAYFALEGSQALVYFPSTRQFARWRDGALAALDWKIDGDVISVGFDSAKTAIVAVRRTDGVWIVDAQDNSLASLPRADGAVLLLEGGTALYTAGDRVVLCRADATETSFDVIDVHALFTMGQHWAAVRTGRATYAVRTEPGREQIFELPEPAQ